MELPNAWSKAMEPNIVNWMHDGFKRYPDHTSEVYDVMSRSQYIYRFHDSAGPRQLSESTVGGSTSELDRQKGYETIASPRIFKNKVSAAWEFGRWNNYPQIIQDSKDLGRAGIYSINLIGAQPFNTGFNTSYTSYGDGKPFFSVAHTRPDGGSNQSNANSSGITLTESNLETGKNAARGQLSLTGALLAVGGGKMTLQVPFALEKEAVIITGSSKRSGTANNDLNWYLGLINVFVNPFIQSALSDIDGNSGSDTHWFLFEKDSHSLTFIWDQRPVYRSWYENDTDAMYTKIYFSCQTVWQNWVGWWGSKGDGASYSS